MRGARHRVPRAATTVVSAAGLLVLAGLIGPGPVAAGTAGPSCQAVASGPHYFAPGSGRTVALTFDDGPGKDTARVLAILRGKGVPATFFDLGRNAAAQPALERAIVYEGHALGNHTWDHAQLTTLSATAQAGEIDRSTAQQVGLLGGASCLLRPPYGSANATTYALAAARHLAVWDWSVDTEDWRAAGSGSAYWVNRITARAEAGATQSHPVVLMHTQLGGNPATVAALPAIIDYYRARGFRFVDLLGRSTPPARPPAELSAPAVAQTAQGLHLFRRGALGDLLERTDRAGSGWEPAWRSLGGALTTGPAVAANTSSTVVAAAVAGGQHVWVRRASDNGALGGWLSLGAVASSRPAASSLGNGRMSVAVRASDGAIWLREVNGGRWGAWQSLGGRFTSAPALATTVDGGLTVVALGSDRAVYVRHRGASWGPWQRVDRRGAADPALATTGDRRHLVLLLRGEDGHGYVSVGDAGGSSWGAWQPLGGILTSGMTATTTGGRLRVFVKGGSGRIYEKDALSPTSAVTGWTAWRLLF